MPENESSPFFHVTVMSAEHTIFNGEAKAISSKNNKNRFDILGYHTNFISVIEDFVEIQTAQSETIRLNIDYGILICENNTVAVYLGIKRLDTPLASNTANV